MSINSIGQEEINRRRLKSDYVNDTDDLTFASKGSGSRGAAYKATREYLDDKEVERLYDDNNYYDDLMKD